MRLSMGLGMPALSRGAGGSLSAFSVEDFGGLVTAAGEAFQTGQYADGSYWVRGSIASTGPAQATVANREIDGTLVQVMTVTGQSATLVAGRTITGGTSGATAVIRDNDGGVLIVNAVTGTFETSETVTESTSGSTATVSAIPAPLVTTVHGAMVNPGNAALYVGGDMSTLALRQAANYGDEEGVGSVGQAFDSFVVSTNAEYDGANAATYPVTEGALVKARSVITGLQAQGRPAVAYLSVFTIVSSAPASGSLRPPIARADKTPVLNTSNLDLSVLRNLDATGISVPSYATALAWLSGTWTFQFDRNANSRNIVPENGVGVEEYFGTTAEQFAQVILGMHTDAWDTEEKTALAIRMGVIALDIAGAVNEGRFFSPNGGHSHGRLPILAFAAKLFGSAYLDAACDVVAETTVSLRLTSGQSVYGDLTQLYYVTQDMIDDSVGDTYPIPQAHLDWPYWGAAFGVDPAANISGNILGNTITGADNTGTTNSASYQGIYGKAAPGASLALRLMTGDAANVPLLFHDYADRYIDVIVNEDASDYVDLVSTYVSPEAGGNAVATWVKDGYAAWSSLVTVWNPAVSAITVDDFLLDKHVFDRGAARDLDSASIPLSGTANAGATIEARLVDEDGTSNPSTWATVATADGAGDWSGALTGQAGSSEWRKAQVREAAIPATVATTTNRCGVGTVVKTHGQSGAFHSFWYSGDIPAETITDEDAVQAVMLERYSDQTAPLADLSPTELAAVGGGSGVSGEALRFFVTNSNPGSPGLAAMANVLTANAPGEKFLVIASLVSGTGIQNEVNADAVEDGRYWGDEIQLQQAADPYFDTLGPTPVGVLLYNYTSSVSATTDFADLVGSIAFGIRATGDEISLPATVSSNSITHIWPELVDVSRAQLAIFPGGNGLQWDFQQAMAEDSATYGALVHPRLAVPSTGYQSGESNGTTIVDITHPSTDHIDGTRLYMKRFAYSILDVIGEITGYNVSTSWDDVTVEWQPEIDSVQRDDVVRLSKPGGFTTLRRQRGDLRLKDVVGYTPGTNWRDGDVVGFVINDGPANHVDIVDESGDPADVGDLLIYKNDGSDWSASDALTFDMRENPDGTLIERWNTYDFVNPDDWLEDVSDPTEFGTGGIFSNQLMIPSSVTGVAVVPMDFRTPAGLLANPIVPASSVTLTEVKAETNGDVTGTTPDLAVSFGDITTTGEPLIIVVSIFGGSATANANDVTGATLGGTNILSSLAAQSLGSLGRRVMYVFAVPSPGTGDQELIVNFENGVRSSVAWAAEATGADPAGMIAAGAEGNGSNSGTATSLAQSFFEQTAAGSVLLYLLSTEPSSTDEAIDLAGTTKIIDFAATGNDSNGHQLTGWTREPGVGASIATFSWTTGSPSAALAVEILADTA